MGAVDDVYGFNPKTGKFKTFSSPEKLTADKEFVPLTPEQQKAYDEGNKGLMPATSPGSPAPAPGQPQVTTKYPKAQPPRAGEVRKGYRFKGGDPADPANWEKLT
jgi:hypothetical protein